MIGKRRMQAEPIAFVVGDKVEEKSFEDGYRGAWFRAQLEEIVFRESEAWCRLKLIDYEQDEDYWMKLYQDVPGTMGCKREMMLRPEFPPRVRHNEYGLGSPGSLVAVVNDDWRVGDVVDWNESGCYWESEIVKVISKNKVKVICPHYPGTWTLHTRLLRPALTWSVDHGWRAPHQSVELVKLEQHNQQQLKKRKCRKLSDSDSRPLPNSPAASEEEWVSRKVVRRAKSTLLSRASKALTEDADDPTTADIFAALREWDLCFQEVHHRLSQAMGNETGSHSKSKSINCSLAGASTLPVSSVVERNSSFAKWKEEELKTGRT